MRLALGFVLLLASLACLAPGARAQPARSDGKVQKPERGDPLADAEIAIRSRNFGLLINSGPFSFEPHGVTCLTPNGRAPVVAGPSGVGGDFMTPKMREAWQYSQAYNRAIVVHPDYPDGDLCRVEAAGDPRSLQPFAHVDAPARMVAAPPKDLFEAARRGSEEDVSRYLAGMPIDSVDGFGMTALAWATARGNLPAIEYLASKEADPWGGRDGLFYSAVRISIAQGRLETFRRLLQIKPRPRPRWPAYMLRDAVASGNTEIVKHITAEPHERPGEFGGLPPARTMALVLDAQPKAAANDLLIRALDRSERLDLVRLALSKGADPNATTGRAPWQTALGLAARGFAPTSVDAVEALLAAGADVNLMAGDRRPLWHAAWTLKLGPVSSETKERATAIFRLLLQNGADPKLPNADGKPPIWSMLFPRSYEPDDLDGSFMTAELLALFVEGGMDVNALWIGRSVLAEVVKQAGEHAPLTTYLRAVGAREIGIGGGKPGAMRLLDERLRRQNQHVR